MSYEPQKIEEKCLSKWASTSLYTTSAAPRRPYYLLEMFPYPSGKLHMGHVRNYAIGDCLARFKRMTGHDVLYPMGFDSFGLPAENAAIKNQIHPESWTLQNIETMKDQLNRLGLSYDWSRTVTTCLPEYYRWNQWLFLKFYEKGLVYRKKGWVNWDPVDQTVLANEQVIDGKGWRSGAEVEKREIEQWYLKITDYAEELLKDLDELTEWPERVKAMQRHWIGKSTGTEIEFKVVDAAGAKLDTLKVFTTRPDTLFGVTYVVLAPEHPLCEVLAERSPHKVEILAFIQMVLKIPQMERSDACRAKLGIDLGIFVVNPATGEKCPLWIGDYVLIDYGTGAVMAVPAHDQRDFDFAQAYGLPIRVVIQPSSLETLDVGAMTEAYTEDGVLVASGEFNGMINMEAGLLITEWLSKTGKGRATVQYKLRDWLISRQRYWGTPIPMVYDDAGTVTPVPETELPVVLPNDVEFTGKGNPLESSPSFTKVIRDGKVFRRETDTMDTFFDSSWYFLRYCDPKNTALPFSKEKADAWMPVQQYIGGIEHAVLHLLYARFFTKVLRDLGLVSVGEPFQRLLCQGMVIKDGAKMSKSLGNTVDPGHIIDKYGADTARVFILFGAPVDRDLDWSDSGVEGAFRFLNRVYRLAAEGTSFPLQAGRELALQKGVHRCVKAVTEDIQRFSYNTAISRMMELVNLMVQVGVNRWAQETLVKVLAPFAPFLTEELWEILGHSRSVHLESWPSYDPALILDETVTIVIQVNGKVRDEVHVDRDSDEAAVDLLLPGCANLGRHLEGKEIVKRIFVRNKLLNLVVR